MTNPKSAKRIVVIGRAASAGKKTDRGELPIQRTTASRIVVIKNGELVGSRKGR